MLLPFDTRYAMPRTPCYAGDTLATLLPITLFMDSFSPMPLPGATPAAMPSPLIFSRCQMLMLLPLFRHFDMAGWPLFSSLRLMPIRPPLIVTDGLFARALILPLPLPDYYAAARFADFR
jgi:hypothetical protein